MKLLEGIGESAVALIVSAAAAFISAIIAAVLVVFVGTRFFWGESSYGFSLAFGPPIALIVGIAVFILLFRKIRSV